MSNKQSSVEWLQVIELERDLTLADWNKAKAMHKEETVDFALKYTFGQHTVGEDLKLSCEKIYNETFNTKDK